MVAEKIISIDFPCLKISQPVGDFFVGVIGYKVLREIADFDVRRVIQDERDVERYLGIQRPLSRSRVEELQQYVEFYDATFPTAIILAVDSDCARYDEKRQVMTLSSYQSDDGKKQILYRQIARVLDGQHRIAGLFHHEGAEFDLNVTIFVGIDIAEQAQIFSTVNLEQTKVNRSLAYDLFALARSRSPQKSCHNVVVALDSDETSPFYKRIKRLGPNTDGRYGETITQATFVESLLNYISADPKGDRDVLLRGQKLTPATEKELRKWPLRNLFIQGESGDQIIGRILWNYFDAVRRTWPDAWNAGGRGMMLNKTNGFRALMKVFGPIYTYFARPGDVVTVEEFLKMFSETKTPSDYFTVDNFPPGSSGESKLINHFKVEFHLE